MLSVGHEYETGLAPRHPEGYDAKHPPGPTERSLIIPQASIRPINSVVAPKESAVLLPFAAGKLRDSLATHSSLARRHSGHPTRRFRPEQLPSKMFRAN